MSKIEKLHGLYVITDTRMTSSVLTQAVSQALTGGARIVQYRDKSTDQARRSAEATALARICTEHGALLIVNDDVALAAASGAHGVHLGQDDAGQEEARKVLGREAVVGVSCYNQLEKALQAQAQGADYVAFGSFFPSPIKPDAVRAEVELLRRARPLLHVPIAAIGGITPDNGRALVDAGADMLAVVSGVFGAEDITAAARAYGFF